MSSVETANVQRMASRHRLIGLVGAVGFFGISLLSYVTPAGVPLMVLTGLLLPLVWGWRTREWAAMGFHRRNLGAALGWGLAAGVVTSAIGLALLQERMLPARLGLELAVGVPLWLGVASPFQELFFRGWLQSQCERGLGKGLGLVATTLVFTLWHYCWPLAAGSSFPLHTIPGVAGTVIAGLVYGYSFQRTRSIVAPWLGHALAGMAYLCVGAASFVEAL